MKFFFDNTLSYRLAHALNTLLELEGHEVVPLRDLFPAETDDEIWLPALKKQGDWVVMTGDLSRRDKNRQVWLESGLTTFFLASAWMGGGHRLTEISARLLRYWDRIVSEATINPPGTCFEVSINGRIKRYPRS